MIKQVTAGKLRFVAAVSSLWMMLCASLTGAHEVTPTIGDFVVEDGQIILDLRMNVEAFVAGINLDGMTDVNDSDQSDRYDMLRALEPQELDGLVRSFVNDWVLQLGVKTDVGDVALLLKQTAIDPVGNVELPRASVLTFSGDLPQGARTVVVRWPQGGGDLVLRQQGVSAPFTGYLAGGQSTDPISLFGADKAEDGQRFFPSLVFGFKSIVPNGPDPILFVVGLCLFGAGLRYVIWKIALFLGGVAIALPLGATGLSPVPPHVLQAVIAMSLVYVASENLRAKRYERSRLAAVFVFGLFHGFGLANEFLQSGTALVGFALGVQVALAMIAGSGLAVVMGVGQHPWFRMFVVRPTSIVIPALGIYWVVQPMLA